MSNITKFYPSVGLLFTNSRRCKYILRRLNCIQLIVWKARSFRVNARFCEVCLWHIAWRIVVAWNKEVKSVVYFLFFHFFFCFPLYCHFLIDFLSERNLNEFIHVLNHSRPINEEAWIITFVSVCFLENSVLVLT